MVLTCPRAIVVVMLLGSPAVAQRVATSEAFDRLEEILELEIDNGVIRRSELTPALLVSTAPRYEESVNWYNTRAIEALTRVFEAGDLRLCEACMAPRLLSGKNGLEQSVGPVSIEDVIRLDANYRGDGEPARSAIWIDENDNGLSVRIVSLKDARIIWARNIDSELIETQRTAHNGTLAEELERRARGASLTHLFADFAVGGSIKTTIGGHISLDWTDQWGKTNANFAGITISAIDPVGGIGGVYYRAINLGTIGKFRFAPLVGAKLILSLPTTIVRAIANDAPDLIDPVLSAVAVIRVPFGRSNYGLVVTASTNGTFAVGVSLLNISLLPVLP